MRIFDKVRVYELYFRISMLSDTKEDYIRAIYTLHEAHGSTGVTQIADKLGLRKSTVSERLKDLVRAGLVNAELYSEVTLTKKGYAIGQKLTFKHRTIEVFLNEILKIPKDQVHEEAHRLEHACSDEVIKRLAAFLHHPTTDPHGSKIPAITSWD
jgi:DtxR family Mn-dependent transcriptional regulator